MKKIVLTAWAAIFFGILLLLNTYRKSYPPTGLQPVPPTETSSGERFRPEPATGERNNAASLVENTTTTPLLVPFGHPSVSNRRATTPVFF